jgi:hypothetical protein
MENKNEIIEFTKVIVENFPEFDDFIDEILEPVKDYTNTLGDIATPFKSIASIFNLSKKLILKSFLKNYARCLTENYQLDTSEVNKLKKYFKNKSNFQFISEAIDSGLHAKSVKSSALLGVIAGKILKDKSELNMTDLVIISSLREMTDIDLENFILLIENIGLVYAEEIEKNGYFEKEFRTKDIYGTEGWTPINVDRLSLKLAIEKLKRTGALSYGEGGIGSVGNALGAFKITPLTKEFYELIKRTKIE